MSNLVSALSWAGPSGSFNPASLSLTGWWRGSYSGAPWAGAASAGGSGSRNLTEIFAAPGVGSAVNGFTPADFNGTTHLLSNGTAISTMLSASAYFVWALVYIDAIDTANALSTAYSNDCVFADSGGFVGIHLTTSGGNKAQFFHWDGAAQGVEIAVSTGAWTLLQQRYDGTNIRAKVNSGSVQTDAAGSISTTTGTIQVGYRGAGYFDGKMLELGMMASAGTDALFDDIRAYVNARYGLAL